MKIAIVLNTSWNIYNFRMGLIKSLQENGHQVVAIAPEDEYTSKLIDAGCEYHKLMMDSRGANILKDLGLIFELNRLYKKIKPDLILHYTIKPNVYGTIAARLQNIPAINNVCGLGTIFLNDNLVSKIGALLYKISFKFPKKVFFQNEQDRQLFKERGLIDDKITDILPGSGIDLTKFHGTDFKRNKNFTFLLISRLIHDKGVLEYIEAIKILKSKGIEAKFQILGAKDIEHKRGIKEELINDWIENNVIEYLGKTDDVRHFINNADCVVLPSYREGTPKSLLEAASSAKPIVATDVPGCREVVDNEINGLLCKIKDPIDLADKMEKMIGLSNEQLKTMGINGRKKMEDQFDEAIVINKYLNSIKELVP